jgi:aromatic ring hydroxylase
VNTNSAAAPRLSRLSVPGVVRPVVVPAKAGIQVSALDASAVMKLLWDAIGTEFGGRHELYERNYAGNHEDIRIQVLTGARRSGAMQAMTDLVDQCMAEYDETGWLDEHWK